VCVCVSVVNVCTCVSGRVDAPFSYTFPEQCIPLLEKCLGIEMTFVGSRPPTLTH